MGLLLSAPPNRRHRKCSPAARGADMAPSRCMEGSSGGADPLASSRRLSLLSTPRHRSTVSSNHL